MKKIIAVVILFCGYTLVYADEGQTLLNFLLEKAKFGNTSDADNSYYSGILKRLKITKPIEYGVTNPQIPYQTLMKSLPTDAPNLTIPDLKETGLEVYKGSVCKNVDEIRKQTTGQVFPNPDGGKKFEEFNFTQFPKMGMFTRSENGKYYLTGGFKRESDTDFLKKIVEVFPERILSTVGIFNIYDNNQSELGAGVALKRDDGKNMFMINRSYFDSNQRSQKQKLRAILHEIGHIVSVTKENTKYGLASCNGYEAKINRCWEKGTPLGDFYNLFWKGNNSPNNDTCLTKYGCTDAAEDFADAFAQYVLADFSTGLKNSTRSVKAKLNFMNLYPEMQNHKKEILARLVNSQMFCGK